MKRRRPLLTAAILLLIVGIAAGLVWEARRALAPPGLSAASRPSVPSPPLRRHARGVLAPVARFTDAAVQTTTPSYVRQPTTGVPAVVSIPSTSVIAYAGTVEGPPESVFLAGLVEIETRVVRDPDFGQPPAVLLSIDLSNVSGLGRSTGMTYVTSGGETLIRRLVASDLVEITFPILPSRPGGAEAARQAVASFTLKFDTGTGRFLAGTATPSSTFTDSHGNN